MATLSRRQQLRLLAELALAGILLASWLALLPAWTDLQDLQSQLVAQQAKLPPPPPGLASLGVLKRELAFVGSALASTSYRLPVCENVSTMLVDLQGVSPAGVDITRFYPTKILPIPLPRVASADLLVSRQRVLIDAQGDFFALRSFLGRLEKFPDPLQIGSIRISRSGSATDLAAVKPSEVRSDLDMEVDLSAFLVDHPVGDPTAAEHALDALVAQLRARPTLPLAAALPGLASLPVTAPPPLPTIPVVSALRLPAPVSSRHPGRAKPTGWKVAGVVAASGETAAAILSWDGVQMAVARGDELPGGWIVERVEPRAVFIRRGLAHKKLPFRPFKP